MYLYILDQFYRVYLAAVTGVAVDLLSGLVRSEAAKHQSRTAAVAAKGRQLCGESKAAKHQSRTAVVAAVRDRPVRSDLVHGISRCQGTDQTFMTTLHNQHQTTNNVTWVRGK